MCAAALAEFLTRGEEVRAGSPAVHTVTQPSRQCFPFQLDPIPFMRLILASTSPRRREILALLGAPFEVIAPEFDEQVSALIHRSKTKCSISPSVRRVRWPATIGAKHRHRQRHDDLSRRRKNRQAGGLADAARILHSLVRQNPHRSTPAWRLSTTVDRVLQRSKKSRSICAPTRSERSNDYLAHGESLDKAGAYSIQGEGSRLIKAIRGDYLAAVGMPLKPIAEYLKSRGISFHREVEKLYREKSFMNWSSFA